MTIENNTETGEYKNIDIENNTEKKPEIETAESLTTLIEGEVSDFEDSQDQVKKIEDSVGLDEASAHVIEKEMGVTEVLKAFDKEAEILKKEAEQNISWIETGDHDFDEESFYRIVDIDGYQDYLNTNIIRSSPTGTKSSAPRKGFVNLGNRPTAFPSFAKGKPDMNYMPKEGDAYILESNVPMYAKGDINPVTGNRIAGRHWAYRPVHEETGENITVMTPEMLKNIYKLSVDGKLYTQKKQ